MRWRSGVFIMTGAIASFAGVAYAATATGAEKGEPSLAVIAALVFTGLSQLGSTGYLINMYVGKVDDSGKAIPELMGALQLHKEAMKTHAENEKEILDAHTKSIQELYNSRNDQGENLTEINTLHEILGCKDRLKELVAELKARRGGEHEG